MFEGVVAAAEAVDEVDMHGLSDAELCDAMVEAQRVRAMMEARAARVTAVWDARKAWAASGAKSGAAWLAWQTRVPRADAARRVRIARRLGDLPVAAAAWAEGRIDEAHVARLVRARNPRTRAVFPDAEEALVAAASSRSYARFDQRVAEWEQTADPDGCDQAARDRYDQRDVSLVESIDGMWFGRMTLDPVAGAAVSAALADVEKELFDADWAEAKARLGVEQPTVSQLRREPGQRRADALVELAARAMTAPAGGRRPAPLFTVHVGYEAFAHLCRIAHTNHPVAPGGLAHWLDDAVIERVLFDGPGRICDVGVGRTYTGAVRRAVQVLGRECYHPTCEEPAERCEADHDLPYAHGGPTTQANGRPACRFHNQWRTTHSDPPPDPVPDDDRHDQPGWAGWDGELTETEARHHALTRLHALKREHQRQQPRRPNRPEPANAGPDTG